MAKQIADWIHTLADVQHGVLVGDRVRLLVADQMLVESLRRGLLYCAHRYSFFMKMPIGRNRDDDQRQAARHGLQRTAQQQAPLAAAQYCTMSSARPPTVKPQLMMKPSS